MMKLSHGYRLPGRVEKAALVTDKEVSLVNMNAKEAVPLLRQALDLAEGRAWIDARREQ